MLERMYCPILIAGAGTQGPFWLLVYRGISSVFIAFRFSQVQAV